MSNLCRRKTSTRGNVETCLYRLHVLFAQKWIYFPFLSLNTLKLINCTVNVLHVYGGKQICRLNHINHILQFPRISCADNLRRFLMICNLFSKLEAFQILWAISSLSLSWNLTKSLKCHLQNHQKYHSYVDGVCK